MKTPLYEWAAVYRPVDEDGDEIKGELKIIQEGKLFASDTTKAIIQIAKLIPAEFDDKIDDIEIILRPF